MSPLRLLPFLLLALLPSLLLGQEGEFRLFKYDKADHHYSQRTSKELSQKEKYLVGLWAGAHREMSWEMDRKADGTYEMVVAFPDDPTIQTYFRGVWGVTEDNQYYYMDLESDYYEYEGQEVRTFYEKITKVTENDFVTSMVNDEGETFISPEKRVKAFRFHYWATARKALGTN